MKSSITIGAAVAVALGLAAAGVADSSAQQPAPQPKEPTQQPAQPKESTQQPAQPAEGQEAQQKPPPAQPAAAPAALDAVSIASLNESDIKSLQEELKSLGFYEAAVDGIVGPQTRAAMTRFCQSQVRLVGQGKISEVTLASLGWSQDQIQRVRGMDQESGSTQKVPEKPAPQQEDTRY